MKSHLAVLLLGLALSAAALILMSSHYPEPAFLLLAGSGLAGLAGLIRRR